MPRSRVLAASLLLVAFGACNRTGVLTPGTPPPGGYWGDPCGDHACRKDEMCTARGCEWIGPAFPDPNGAFEATRRPSDAGADADGAT